MIYSTEVKENQMADTKIKILWKMKERMIYLLFAIVLQRMSDTEKQRERESHRILKTKQCAPQKKIMKENNFFKKKFAFLFCWLLVFLLSSNKEERW